MARTVSTAPASGVAAAPAESARVARARTRAGVVSDPVTAGLRVRPGVVRVRPGVVRVRPGVVRVRPGVFGEDFVNGAGAAHRTPAAYWAVAFGEPLSASAASSARFIAVSHTTSGD